MHTQNLVGWFVIHCQNKKHFILFSRRKHLSGYFLLNMNSAEGKYYMISLKVLMAPERRALLKGNITICFYPLVLLHCRYATGIFPIFFLPPSCTTLLLSFLWLWDKVLWCVCVCVSVKVLELNLTSVGRPATPPAARLWESERSCRGSWPAIRSCSPQCRRQMAAGQSWRLRSHRGSEAPQWGTGWAGRNVK